MALPKRKKNLQPRVEILDSGKFRDYDFDRVADLMEQTNDNTKYLPKTVGFFELDDAVFEFVNGGDGKIAWDGKDIPTIYMDNERWGEFEKTWKISDGDKNILTPFITVKRIDKKKGTRMGEERARIPFFKGKYMDVPIIEDGERINLRYKVPQPVNVDLTYEISLFSKDREMVNFYDENMFTLFSEEQKYVEIQKYPVRLTMESVEEKDTVQEVGEADKMFVSSFNITIHGFIINEEDYELTKTTRRPKLGTGI